MASESAIPAELIGRTAPIQVGALNTFHRNPRKGDIDAIAGSLKANGQFKPIVVNRGTHTGRPDEVLAGNHTLMAFRRLREQNPFDNSWTMIQAHIVDVDDDMANRIVVADNRTFEMGEGTDGEVVLELLRDGTTGTGYTDDDLDKLEAAFNRTRPEVDPADEDSTEDEPEKPDLPQRETAIGFTLVFDDADQQDVWFAWIKKLREEYPDTETVGERLLAHLADTAGERV